MTNTDQIADFDKEEWQTELVISQVGIPLYSARGIKQTIRPVTESGDMSRDVQGDLDDYSDENFRKFETTISCEDMRAPAFDGFWPGMHITIECIVEFCCQTGAEKSREAVEGSEWEDGNFTIYRPKLECRIAEYEITRDEYEQVVSWSLRAIEI